MPLPGTDVEIVAYSISDLDLMVLVNAEAMREMIRQVPQSKA